MKIVKYVNAEGEVEVVAMVFSNAADELDHSTFPHPLIIFDWGPNKKLLNIDFTGSMAAEVVEAYDNNIVEVRGQ
jgi:hypothetical protein